MRHAFFHGAGRATQDSDKGRFFVVGAPGGAPDGPPPLAEVGSGTLGGRPVPPMLFAGNSLRPGPPPVFDSLWVNHRRNFRRLIDALKKYDRITSLFFLLFAVLICTESIRLPKGLGSFREAGPGLLPFFSGFFLGVLSLIVLLKSILAKTGEIRRSWYPKERWKTLVLVLAALSGFAISLDILGFLIDTFLLLFVLFKFVGLQRWIVATGGSLFVAMVSYVIFGLWLKVQLPTGFWGF
jgi:putative tricarboxylic transport membrane protein